MIITQAVSLCNLFGALASSVLARWLLYSTLCIHLHLLLMADVAVSEHTCTWPFG
jgi:hypothetical protein